MSKTKSFAEEAKTNGDSLLDYSLISGADGALKLSRRQAIWVTVCLVVLLVTIFARMMNFEMRRDEQLYVAPASLLENWSLYKDFFYNHVPGSAWLFHSVMTVLGTDHLLLAARLGVFFGWILLAVGVAWISWKLTYSVALTVFSIVTILSNDMLLNQTGMTGTNNLLPLPFALLGIGCFILGVNNERGHPILALVAGLMLGLAASIKANAIGFILPIAVAALFLPTQLTFVERIRRIVLPLVVGGIVGALPVLYFLIFDTERFLAHVVAFHTGPHVDYWSARTGSDEEAAMALADKAKLAYSMWVGGTNLIALLMIAMLFTHLFSSFTFRDAIRRATDPRLLIILAALIVTATMSFIPTPSFPQYFAQPLVCIPIVVSLLFASLSSPVRSAVQPAFIAASILVVLINAPRLGQYLPKLSSPAKWTVMRVHDSGLAIASRLQGLGVKGKIATLAPIYPLEGKLDVYPELSTGQFVYRVADMAEPDLLRHYRTTSPKMVEALFAADPPAAILAGFDPELEAPMVRFAQARGYQRIDDLGLKDRYGTAVLYVRPASSP